MERKKRGLSDSEYEAITYYISVQVEARIYSTITQVSITKYHSKPKFMIRPEQSNEKILHDS